MRRRWITNTLVIWVAVSLSSHGQTIAVQKALEAKFVISKTTGDRSGFVTVGDQIQLQKDGLMMVSASTSSSPLQNVYEGGEIKHSSGGKVAGKVLNWGMMAPTPSVPYMPAPPRPTIHTPRTRLFAAGEIVRMTSIEVTNDSLIFGLCTDPSGGSMYFATLRVHFSGRSLSVDDASAIADQLFKVASKPAPKPGSLPPHAETAAAAPSAVTGTSPGAVGATTPVANAASVSTPAHSAAARPHPPIGAQWALTSTLPEADGTTPVQAAPGVQKLYAVMRNVSDTGAFVVVHPDGTMIAGSLCQATAAYGPASAMDLLNPALTPGKNQVLFLLFNRPGGGGGGGWSFGAALVADGKAVWASRARDSNAPAGIKYWKAITVDKKQDGSLDLSAVQATDAEVLSAMMTDMNAKAVEASKAGTANAGAAWIATALGIQSSSSTVLTPTEKYQLMQTFQASVRAVPEMD